MRKRFNSLRSRRGTGNSDMNLAGPSNGVGGHEGVLDPMRNPWQDAGSRDGPSNIHPLNHRLSFDMASGVITLPDNADWLDEEPDSDEDVQHEDAEPLDMSIIAESVRGEDDENVVSPTAPVSTSPTRMSRYGTYFHHPERRRQVIPGAFPGR